MTWFHLLSSKCCKCEVNNKIRKSWVRSNFQKSKGKSLKSQVFINIYSILILNKLLNYENLKINIF